MDNEHIKNAKKAYNCRDCSLFFSRKVQFDKHRCQQSISENDLNCPVCAKKFKNSHSLKIHSHKHDLVFKCDVCCKKFKSSRSLKSHSYKHNPVLKCSICCKVFKSSRSLKIHSYEHGPVFNCNVCGKKFKNSRSLKMHSYNHDGEKLLKCEVCEEEFRKPYSLKIHSLIHHPKKFFKCEFCKKKFSTENDLRKHCYIHQEYEVKPFFCNSCENRFLWEDQLRTHFCHAEHDRDMLYETPQNKNFGEDSSVSSRSIDLYTFSNNNSVICGICQRKFSQKGHFIIHYRRTHKRECVTIDV